MSHPFVDPFIKALRATPIRVVVDDDALDLHCVNAEVEDDVLTVHLRVMIWSNVGIEPLLDDITDQEVDWIALDAPALLTLSVDALHALAIDYIAGWSAAVTARIRRVGALDALFPSDCVPRLRRCPLRLKTLPVDSAGFERLFLVKSRLPELIAST